MRAASRPLGPVIPFVLLESIEGHLPAMAVGDLPSTEAAVTRLLEAVLSRPDGHWLGRAWLQQIFRQQRPSVAPNLIFRAATHG